jgi:hypothetical protein
MGMKAEIEAMRALAYVAAAALDKAEADPDQGRRQESKRFAEFLNPIVKGWCTERGQEIASIGVQIHGGMGYAEETGAAQHLRDARITTIYEGTTAIQANDLVNRKILRDQGATLRQTLAEAAGLAEELSQSSLAELKDIGEALARGVDDAEQAAVWLLQAASQDPRQSAAAGVPLLLLLGTVLGGWQMARAARLSAERVAAADGGDQTVDKPFHQGKLLTAWHYAETILPHSSGLKTSLIRGSRTVMALSKEQL